MWSKLRHQWIAIQKFLDSFLIIGAALLVLGILLYSLATIPGVSWLHDAGTALLVAGISLIVSTASGKEAVRQQHAKDANIERKNALYAPVYSELRQLWELFEHASKGEAPYPHWVEIKGAGETPGYTQLLPYALHSPFPRFTCWPDFQSDHRAYDFTPKAQALLKQKNLGKEFLQTTLARFPVGNGRNTATTLAALSLSRSHGNKHVRLAAVGAVNQPQTLPYLRGYGKATHSAPTQTARSTSTPGNGTRGLPRRLGRRWLPLRQREEHACRVADTRPPLGGDPQEAQDGAFEPPGQSKYCSGALGLQFELGHYLKSIASYFPGFMDFCRVFCFPIAKLLPDTASKVVAWWLGGGERQGEFGHCFQFCDIALVIEVTCPRPHPSEVNNWL